MTGDRYSDFAHLAAENRMGVDYAITVAERPCGVAVLALHGGGIEPGTSELARAIAGEDLSLYLFEGLRESNNQDLHISSTCFDEPRCLELVRRSPRVLTVHGCRDGRAVVYVGGQDLRLREHLEAALTQAGAHVEVHHGEIAGKRRANICNQGLSGQGAQLEFSYGMRQLLFEDVEARKGRRHPLPLLFKTAEAIRRGLLDVQAGL